MRGSRGTSLVLHGRIPPESPLIGLEHEFRVMHGAEQLDFRNIVGTLTVDGRRIDAGDVRAYRCAWGGVITADGREAEIAVAPVECAPGFVNCVDAQAARAYTALRDALPGDLLLDGYSTHLSVATPTRLTSRVASIYAQRFAAPMMMLLDRRESPGLLVRTRPGRTELCGEYATGSALRGATAFAAGSVLASIRAASDRRYRRQLPPAIDVTLAPAAQRTGWYVDRCGFGTDLYAGGRLSRLHTRRGVTTAQCQLEQAWTVACDALRAAGLAQPDDLVATERMVGGMTPLPIETAPDESLGGESSAPASPFGDAITDRERRWGRVSAAAMSWDVVIFALAGVRVAFAAVPRRELNAFLSDLDAGRLDDAIGRFLAASSTGSRLMSATDVERASLYDEVSADGLAPVEPRPGAPRGRVESMIDRLHGSDGGRGGRDEKNRRDGRSEQPGPNASTPEPTPSAAPAHARKMSRAVVLGGAVSLIVALAAGVALASSGGDGPTVAAAPSTTVGQLTGSTVARPGSSASPTTRRAGAPSATAPSTTAEPIRFRATQTTFSAEWGVTHGTCANGATPGKVVVWAGPDRFPNSVYSATPPAGHTAYEMTWVGADRYEVLFPDGAVDIGTTGLQVVADCSGATTRKSGPSLRTYSMANDIENAPITEQPFVILKAEIDPRLNECTSPGTPIDVKTMWGVSGPDHDFDPSTIFAEELMQLGPDGAYRVSIETRRYFDELMPVGHWETTHYRCDWGNG